MSEKRSGLTSIRLWWLGIPGGFFLMAFILGLITMPDRMLNIRNIQNILTSCGPTLLISAAICVPFARGHMDFSAIGVGCFCSTLIGIFSNHLGLPSGVASLIAVLIGAIIGLVNGLISIIFRRKNPIFMAAATACIGAFYRYIALVISNGSPILVSKLLPTSGALFFLLPAILLTGIFALISFTKGGAHDFNGIYKKETDCSRCTIVSCLISGALAGLAAVLSVARMRGAMPTAFSFSPTYLLPLALAGITVPNVKKSKVGAFLGYLGIIPGVLATQILQNFLMLCGVDNYILNFVTAFIAIIFIILNAILGSKAAKIEYAPAKPAPAKEIQHAAPPAYEPTVSPYAALEEITRMYRSGEISEREYIMRKNEILSRM